MSEPTDRFMAVVRPAEGFNFPYPDKALPENSLNALVVHSLIQAKRLLITWMRDPSTTIQALVYPAFMLLMFRVVLGNSISAATGQASIFGTVPLINSRRRDVRIDRKRRGTQRRTGIRTAQPVLDATRTPRIRSCRTHDC